MIFQLPSNSNQLDTRLEAHNKHPPTDDTNIETVLQGDHYEDVEGEPQATAANPSYGNSGHQGSRKLVPAKKSSSAHMKRLKVKLHL